MLKKRTFIAVALMVVLVICGWQSAMAQMKIGYIDSNKILSTYAPAVDAQKKLEAEAAQWGQELQKMQDDFRSQQEALEQQSLLLSDAKKREKAEELQVLYTRIQQYQNEKWGDQGEFFKRRNQLMQPVIETIDTAIKALGDREGYDFIFDAVQGNLLHAKAEYDLTDKVLKELESSSSESSK